MSIQKESRKMIIKKNFMLCNFIVPDLDFSRIDMVEWLKLDAGICNIFILLFWLFGINTYICIIIDL